MDGKRGVCRSRLSVEILGAILGGLLQFLVLGVVVVQQIDY